MSLDGIALSGLRRELAGRLTGARVQKIYQPTAFELSIIFYRGVRERLRVSAHPAQATIYLTTRGQDHPGHPPAFCQILRKHLEGAKVSGITQVEPFERVLRLDFEASDMSGGGPRSLVVELMGKHSNVILLDREGTVIDAVKRITAVMSRYREVLPGKPYVLPPDQEKIDPRRVEAGDLEAMAGSEELTAGSLVKGLAGVGPVTAREAIHRCSGRNPAEMDCLAGFLRHAASMVEEGEYRPTLAWSPDGNPWCFAPFDLTHVGGVKKEAYPDLNQLLDSFYSVRFHQQRLEERRARAGKAVRSALDKAERRLANLYEDMAAAKKGPEYRRLGELLMANLHQVSEGSEAVVEDYHSPGSTVTIPMDPSLTPVKNAQNYFKRYAKTKKALAALKLQIDKAQREVAYLEQSLLCVDQAASPEEASSILDELESEGYLGRTQPRKRARQKPAQVSRAPSWNEVPHYVSKGSVRIFVGRNNRQNDLLTMKLASPEDVWLHAKNVPGSHVLLRSEGQRVSAEDLEEAALLAAYHSRARQGSQVPVDYTLRKDVWKPRGAKPGMVLYRNHRTVYVTPDEVIIKAIMERTESNLGQEGPL